MSIVQKSYELNHETLQGLLSNVFPLTPWTLWNHTKMVLMNMALLVTACSLTACAMLGLTTLAFSFAGYVSEEEAVVLQSTTLNYYGAMILMMVTMALAAMLGKAVPKQ